MALCNPQEYMEDISFRTTIRENKFEIRTTQKGPDSVYEAFAYMFTGNKSTAAEIREKLFVHISRSKMIFQSKLGYSNKADFQAEVDSILEPKTLWTDLAIIAASSLFDARINVITPEWTEKVFSFQSDNLKDVYISINKDNVYVLEQERLNEEHAFEALPQFSIDQVLEAGGMDIDEDLPSNDVVFSNSGEDEPNVEENMEYQNQHDSNNMITSQTDSYHLGLVKDLATFEQARDISMSEHDEQSQDLDVNVANDTDYNHDFEDVLPSNDSADNLKGFKSVERNLTIAAKNPMTITILIPGISDKETIEEALEELKPNAIYMLVMAAGKDLNDLRNDADMPEDFTAFTYNRALFNDPKYLDQSIWKGNLTIIPLILTALNFTWRKYEVILLCQDNAQGTIMSVINTAWTNVKDDIITSIESIVANPDSYMCVNCPPDCIFKGQPWHFDMVDFQKLQWNTPTQFGFWTKYGGFANQRELSVGLFQELKRMRNEETEVTLSVIGELLDETESKWSGRSYWSYLVLLVDGKDMINHKLTAPLELIKNSGLTKSVYAGSCTNEQFRKSHFTAFSSINEVLTNTTRLHVIRKKKFVTRAEARKDEAIVIEILKNYLKPYWEENRRRPFILLNKKSQQSELLPIDKPEMTHIHRFNMSKIPIYQGYCTNLERYNWYIFPGNYVVKEEIPNMFNRSGYTYNDVKHLYERLQRQQRI